MSTTVAWTALGVGQEQSRTSFGFAGMLVQLCSTFAFTAQLHSPGTCVQFTALARPSLHGICSMRQVTALAPQMGSVVSLQLSLSLLTLSLRKTGLEL